MHAMKCHFFRGEIRESSLFIRPTRSQGTSFETSLVCPGVRDHFVHQHRLRWQLQKRPEATSSTIFFQEKKSYVLSSFNTLLGKLT